MSRLEAKDAEHLRHILDASMRIESYVNGMRSALDDPKTLDAVLHCLTIIGEALGALSNDAYSALPSLPPSSPVAMRNVIVHEYWRLDPSAIWRTVSKDLPALRDDVERALTQG